MRASGAKRIEAAIRSPRGGRGAIAAFLTAGYPHRDGFPTLLEAVSREADVVEIGVPFTDPMADGVTIQNSSRAALAQGVTLPWILETIGDADIAAPVLLMSYLNPLLAFGIDRLAAEAAARGIGGFIVPDLPFEESTGVRRAFSEHGLALVQLVTPVTPDDRLRKICQASEGFVYAVTVTGTTGGNGPVRNDVKGYLERVRACSAAPVLAGFGIRRAEQIAEIVPPADGVIVGSALIEALSGGEDGVGFVRGLRG